MKAAGPQQRLNDDRQLNLPARGVTTAKNDRPVSFRDNKKHRTSAEQAAELKLLRELYGK